MVATRTAAPGPRPSCFCLCLPDLHTMAARRRSIALLALALLLAGCTVSLGGETATPTPAIDRTATVTHVVDGDTIEVRFADGSTDTVRLLGVDSPETHAETTAGEYEGVPDTEAGRQCLRAAGENATAAVRDRIAGTQVRVVTDPVADRRGGYDRLLAYVETDEGTLNEWLLRTGHGRVFDSEFTRSDTLYELEATAQDAGRGLWACKDPP